MVNENDGSQRESKPVVQGTTAVRRTARFEDLDVWSRAHALVLAIYKVTAFFPVEERFGLVTQMRRAAISVAANIAEGAKKRTARDQFNFYNIAQGSLEELRYYLILTRDLGYPSERLDALNSDLDRVARMLYSLAQTRRP
jgi:four helix bundle protein